MKSNYRLTLLRALNWSRLCFLVFYILCKTWKNFLIFKTHSKARPIYLLDLDHRVPKLIYFVSNVFKSYFDAKKYKNTFSTLKNHYYQEELQEGDKVLEIDGDDSSMEMWNISNFILKNCKMVNFRLCIFNHIRNIIKIPDRNIYYLIY